MWRTRNFPGEVILRDNVADRSERESVSVLSFYFLQMAPMLTTTSYYQVFNYRVSRYRCLTENTFGVLVATWRILSQKIDLEPEKVKLMVLACCFPRNYLRANRQPPQGYCLLEIVGQAWEGRKGPIQATGIRTGTNAMQIRDSFKHYINVIAPLLWQTDVI